MSGKKYKQFVAAAMVTLVVVALTHIPMKYMSHRLCAGGFDKLIHAVAYGVITIFFLRAVRASISILSVFFIFCMVISIGAIDELTQSFVDRTVSMNDWFADVTGCFIVLCVVLYFHLSQKIISR